jgi:hypothetical protein
MQIVKILRQLWRVRLLVAIAAIVSLLLGLMVAFKLPSLQTRQYDVGIATVRMLVDTPKSQVIEVAPKGSDVLGGRANLLANVMVQGVVKASIAERAHISGDDLVGIAESAADGTPVAPPSDPSKYVLTTRVVATTDGDLPIVEIEARAPDGAGAAQLAGAAVGGLTAYLDDKASQEAVADGSRLRVSGLGDPQATVVTRGPGLTMAFAVMIFAFLALCGLILAVLGVIRAWRADAEAEFVQYRTSDRLVALDGFLRGHDSADVGEPEGAEPHPAPWSPPNADGSNGGTDADAPSRRSQRRSGRAAG